jgi:hypothetical protein
VAKLTAKARKSIPTSDFAVPSKAKTPSDKVKSGNYPVNDLAHARNALSRSSGKSVESQVRAKVLAKFPALKKGAK